jgi:hypothetical protein
METQQQKLDAERNRLQRQYLRESGLPDPYAEIERLSHALALAHKALRQIQWSGGYGETSMCPLCDQVPENGHAPDCHLGMALP